MEELKSWRIHVDQGQYIEAILWAEHEDTQLPYKLVTQPFKHRRIPQQKHECKKAMTFADVSCKKVYARVSEM